MRGAGPAGVSAAGPGEKGAASEPQAPRRRRRSIAWVYYTVLAILSVVVTAQVGDPHLLLGTVAFAAYATYLYRGGRFVVWIW